MSDEERLAELAEKAKSLVQESRELANAAKAALDEWAVAACPFKVGQECEVPKEAYAHIGKRCVVSKVRGDVAWRDDLDWVVHAIVLRKDGSQSAKTVSWEKWAWEQGNKKQRRERGMSEKVRLHGGPFVPGEVYRTRGGEEMVFVGEMPKWVAVNVEDRLVFTGRSGSLSRYYENGEYDTGCPGIYDIVVPVEEEPPVNIDLPVSIPPDVKCVKVNGVEFRRVAESD